MVEIHGVSHQGIPHFGDTPPVPQDVINTINQLSGLMSSLLNNTFSQFADQIAAAAGSQSAMANVFNGIISALNNVLSTMQSNPDFSNFWTGILYNTNYAQLNFCMVEPTMTSEINTFLSALGNPANNPPGGLYQELQQSDYIPSSSMLSYLITLVTPFTGSTPMYGSYPSSWDSTQIQLYQSFWGSQEPAILPSTCHDPLYMNQGSFLGIMANVAKMIADQSTCVSPNYYLGMSNTSPMPTYTRPWIAPTDINYDGINYFDHPKH